MKSFDDFDRDFDRDFVRSERRFRITFGFAVALIVLIFLAIVTGLGMIAYQLATTNPDDIAKGAGHLVGTFMKATK